MKDKFLIFLSSSILIMVWVVVALGAYTRLVDAGLGCPDWPTCYGHFWVPDTAQEIELANTLFADTPVEIDKTWPEQIHRIFAKNLGLLILVLYLVALFKEKKSKKIGLLNNESVLLTLLVAATIIRIFAGDAFEPIVAFVVFLYVLNLCRLWRNKDKSSISYRLVASLAGMVILQGLFGMWTVTLKLWPQVVTAHLLGGFTTLSIIALLWSLILWPKFSLKIKFESISHRLLVPAFVVVVLQITLGGWMTSNYAALACPELPTCQSYWWPETNFAQGFNFLQRLGPNYLGGQLDNASRVAIHLTHRIGAVFTLILVAAFAVSLWRQTRDLTTRFFAATLLCVLTLQLSLGLANIIYALPLPVAVSHNAGGACLLVLMLIALCRNTLRSEAKRLEAKQNDVIVHLSDAGADGAR